MCNLEGKGVISRFFLSLLNFYHHYLNGIGQLACSDPVQHFIVLSVDKDFVCLLAYNSTLVSKACCLFVVRVLSVPAIMDLGQDEVLHLIRNAIASRTYLNRPAKAGFLCTPHYFRVSLNFIIDELSVWAGRR